MCIRDRLNKLAELAKRPLSPEELEARMTQAQIIMSLKPWKTLLKNG